MTDYCVVVTKSTVPVGTGRKVSAAIAAARPNLREGEDYDVASNPEFLREGSAIGDFMRPDRVVIGSADRGAAERVAELYATIDTPILITDPASAETIKYAANGFLAMKISFVNAVAAMCEAVGADVAAVVDGIGPWIQSLYTVRGGRVSPTPVVEQAHAVGLAVHPYTFRLDELPPGFDSFEALVRFCARDLAIDGLFTDFPDQVLELFRRIFSAGASN